MAVHVVQVQPDFFGRLVTIVDGLAVDVLLASWAHDAARYDAFEAIADGAHETISAALAWQRRQIGACARRLGDADANFVAELDSECLEVGEF